MFKEIVAPHILEIIPYKPGKPISEVKRELGLDEVIKLASNENPLGPSPRAKEVIQKTIGELHYYPEDSGYFLRNKLSEKLNIDPEMIVLGNGSSEIIVNIGRAFLKPGDQILTSETSFVMYALCGAYTNNKVIQTPMKDWSYDLDALAGNITSNTRIIFIANPNNPTGTYFGKQEWESFLNKVPSDVLVVLDEAYCEYVDQPNYPNGLDYLREYSNLVILRTFSKIYGLAGIRVGYGIASKELVDILYRVKLPFNANALGQEAAIAALDDDEFVSQSRDVNRKGLKFLEEFFRKNNVSCILSVANFIMITLPVDGNVCYEKMKKRGVLIRPLRGFGCRNGVRVTVGRMEENMKFADAFIEVIKEIEAERK